MDGFHKSRTYEEPILCECSISVRCSIVTWWYDRTLQRCVRSCTTPPGTFAHTSLHSPQADAWSTHSADLSCRAMPPVLRTNRTQTVSEIVFSMYSTHKVSLTSWFSWKSTMYSERCCLMNFLMISCLIRGSRTFATKQASLRTLLGPPDFCKYQIKCVTGMIQRLCMH